MTTDQRQPKDWFHTFQGADLDGLIAKPLDGSYVQDKRVQFKLKHVRTDPVDFRKSINGLSLIVEQSLELNPFELALYVFINPKREKPLPADLPRVKNIVELAPSERQCSCGCELVEIGEHNGDQ